MLYDTGKGEKSNSDLQHPSFCYLQSILNTLTSFEVRIFAPAFKFDFLYIPCCELCACIKEELIMNFRTDLFRVDIHV